MKRTLLDFRPPLDSPVLIGFAKWFLPLYMRYGMQDTRVVPAAGAVERFKSLAGQRALVCPNHSNRDDPQSVFAFSSLVGEEFNFIAAREVFDWNNGLNGWLLQHLGCYSVVRGAADRESFKTTKRILCDGKKKLVLFPEGEISRQNDTLMPLESGAAQMALWALDDLAKQNQGKELPDLYIIPVALKYTFGHDVQGALSHCLHELEARLSIKSAGGQEALYPRLRKVAETLLATLEIEYGFKPADEGLNSRINALRSHILLNVARQLNVQVSTGARQLESVRVMRNAMDEFIYMDETSGSDYQRTIHEEKASALKNLYSDLDRVVNFIAIYDGYLTENMTQERFSDILDRLEREIMRKREPSYHGSRRVLLDVGEPINMSKSYADYKKDKRATISKITEQIFAEISRMMIGLEKSTHPLTLS